MHEPREYLIELKPKLTQKIRLKYKKCNCKLESFNDCESNL